MSKPAEALPLAPERPDVTAVPATDPHPPSVIPGLDGIRAVAILLVILWHSALQTQFPPDALGLLRPLVITGWAGVDLFFALSGFLITGLLLDEERATGRLDLGRFYARRALRIFPAFYLVLAVDLLVLRRIPAFASLAGAGGGGFGEVAALTTYWSNYYYVYADVPRSSLLVFWSLCVEEHFYLVWPLFLATVRDTRLRILTALGACALLPLARLAAGPTQLAAIHLLSHFRLDSLLWGALAALALPQLLRQPRTIRLLIVGSAAILALLYMGGHVGVNLSPLGYTVGYAALAVFASALAVQVTHSRDGYMARLLSFPPLRAVGRVSYGMYLVHFQVIDLVAPRMAAVFPAAVPVVFVVLAGAVATGSFAVAFAMYRLWERPFLRLKDRFTPPRKPLASIQDGPGRVLK